MRRWAIISGVIASIVLLVLVAVMIGGDSTDRDSRRDRRRADRSPSGSPTTGTAPPVSPTSPAAPASPGTVLPLGTLAPASPTRSCPDGERCQGFEISCPDVRESAVGTMAIGDASGSPQGVVVFFGGGRGTGFSGTSNQDAMTAMLEDLHREGLATVRVAWKSPWLFSAPGEQIGPRPLGCRPATMVKWVHDNLYQQIGADPALGECGLCIVGDSGGASQVVYPLVDYGLDSMIDTAVPISGPVHTGLAAGCLHDDSGDRALWYSAGFSAPIIDGAYGFFNGGPCQSHDPSWAERWEADSIDAAGRDFHFPNTRVVILFGSKDGSSGPPHGELFFDRLRSAETPFASVETVQGMGHLFSNSPQGLEAVRNVLLGAA